ncbi:MAG: Crp/Fnr family transcriptional regulator [Candidatus Borkfalkiaceae bacterium]|nr:Crp/Fnr family transcriptional regulator [Christensenellaceae bacterium]
MKYLRNPLFEGIAEDRCESLMKNMSARETEYLRGQTVYSFSDGKDCVAFLTEGTARIVKIDENGNEIFLEKLAKGNLFGSRFSYGGREGDLILVKAESKCSAAFIPFASLLTSCNGNGECRHALLMNLFREISRKSATLSERIEILSNRTIREKLMCYFSVCKAKQGSDTFRMEMSLSALSEYLCVDRSAMMRELKHLKEEGCVTVCDKKVTLK